MEFVSLFQVSADSLATDIGGVVGATVSGWVLLAYSILNKYATEIGKFVLKIF